MDERGGKLQTGPAGAGLVARQCEQLRSYVTRLESSITVPRVSAPEKLDYSFLNCQSPRELSPEGETQRQTEQKTRSAARVRAFLEELRPDYSERLERHRRDEARKTAVALLREQERLKAEARRLKEERRKAEALRQEMLRVQEQEQKEARLTEFYRTMDAFVQPMERLQAEPEI